MTRRTTDVCLTLSAILGAICLVWGGFWAGVKEKGREIEAESVLVTKLIHDCNEAMVDNRVSPEEGKLIIEDVNGLWLVKQVKARLAKGKS